MGLPENGKQNGGDDGRADQGSRTSHRQNAKGIFSVDALDVGGGLVFLVFSGVFHVAGGWFHIVGFLFDFLVVLCGLTIITHHVDKQYFKLFGLRYWLALIVTFGIFSALAVHVMLKENANPLPPTAAESKPVDVVKKLDTNELRAIVVEAVKNANTNVPQTLEIKKIEWQPPELPAGCKLVTVTSAGGTIQNPTAWPSWTVMNGNDGVVVVPNSPINISAHVVNNRFYVDADITWDGITAYAISNMTFIGTMPENWDRNSNSNAFEIVGPDHLPVFQEIYVVPEHIILNGIFPNKPGIIIGMFDTHMISGFPSEVLTGFPNRKPIFKYPSWKYPGVLAD